MFPNASNDHMYENHLTEWYIDILSADFPGFANQVESVLRVQDYYIYFKLEDGSILRYDDILKIISVYRNEEEMKRRLHVSEDNLMDVIKTKIYRCMELEGMSQMELAERTGMSVGAICKYVNGYSVPSAVVLYKIATVLDRDMNYFFDIL